MIRDHRISCRRHNRGEVGHTIEQSIIKAVRGLPPEKQQELLEHANRLRDESTRKKPFKSIKGMLAGRGISISAEGIDQVHREMWNDFPREDI